MPIPETPRRLKWLALAAIISGLCTGCSQSGTTSGNVTQSPPDRPGEATQSGAISGAKLPPSSGTSSNTAGSQTQPVPTGLTAEPGIIKGKALDVLGKPIAQAEIVFEVLSQEGEKSEVKGITDESGFYSLPFSGRYARFTDSHHWVNFNGQAYDLPLDPDDHQTAESLIEPAKGAVKNFTFRVHGLRYDSHKVFNEQFRYYGGHMKIDGLYDSKSIRDGQGYQGWMYPPEMKVTYVVDLTPQGPLIDGSKGESLHYEITVPKEEHIHKDLYDIPLGKYKISVSLITESGDTLQAQTDLSGVTGDVFDRSFNGILDEFYFPPDAPRIVSGTGSVHVDLYI